MKSTVSFGASLVTSQPSTLGKISLALPLPPLTSGKKTQPIFSSGNPLPSAESERPSVRSQLPIRWNAVFPSWKVRSEEHTSELQSHLNLVCRLLLEKKNRGRNSAADVTSASDSRIADTHLPPDF